MKLELTRIVKTRKKVKESQELSDGLRILYYGQKYTGEDNPFKGVIREQDDEFYISWDDNSPETKIDNSEKSVSILKYCAFE